MDLGWALETIYSNRFPLPWILYMEDWQSDSEAKQKNAQNKYNH